MLMTLTIVLTSCKTTQVEKDKVIFPNVPAVFNENGEPYISYEYKDSDGNVIRTKDLSLENVTIQNVIIPYWLWKNFIYYIIDTEAAIDRLNTKEELYE